MTIILENGISNFTFFQVSGDDKLEKIFARFESLMPRVNETKLVTDMLWKSYEVSCNTNKMELLQSQAPVDWKLLGSSAIARHGTFDIRH